MSDQHLNKPQGLLTTKYQVYFFCIASVIVLEHAGRLLLGVSFVGGVYQWLLGILSVQL